MTGWEQKRRHMRYYNRIASSYNMRYAEEQDLKIDAALKRLELESHDSVLDLGCGTGILVSRMHNAVQVAVGLDVSKGMLKEIEGSVKDSSNVHFIIADVDHTPIRSEYFDMVFAITLLQNMPNSYVTLQEAKRVAKRDAPVIVTGLKKCFTKDSFIYLLKGAGFNTRLLEIDENLKCHIAICGKPKLRA